MENNVTLLHFYALTNKSIFKIIFKQVLDV